MTTAYNKTKHIAIRENFNKYISKIRNYETRKLPEEADKRKAKIDPYLDECVNLHNELVSYLELCCENKSIKEEQRQDVLKEITSYRLKAAASLETLGYTVDLPIEFGKLNRDELRLKDSEDDFSEIFVSSARASNKSKENLANDGKTSDDLKKSTDDTANKKEPKTTTSDNLNDKQEQLTDEDLLNLTYYSDDDILNQTLGKNGTEHPNDPVANENGNRNNNTNLPGGTHNNSANSTETGTGTVPSATQTPSGSGDGRENPSNNQSRIENRTTVTMPGEPMSIDNFMNMCSRHFKTNFGGNPAELSAFLATGKLLERFATTDDLKSILCAEMYTKLVGSAATAVGAMPETYDDLVDKLKERVKYDSSRIVKAQIKSVKANHGNLDDYVRKIDTMLEKFK